jgi:hypothetical protein
MRGIAIAAIVGCSACNAILGLDRTHVASDGAPGADAIPADANPDDLDGDGVANEKDNCPNVYNPDQADEDGDKIGDVCDDCPEVANPDQADTGEVTAGALADGIGDACDPNPSMPGDVRALFEPFNDPAEVAAHWTVQIGTWNVTGGAFVQSDASAASALAYFDKTFTDATVDVQATITSSAATTTPAGAGMWMSMSPGGVTIDGTYPDGYLCGLIAYATASPVDAHVARWNQQVVGPSMDTVTSYLPKTGDAIAFYGAIVSSLTQARCTPSFPGAAVGEALTDPKFAPTGTVGLHTSNVTLAFRSITVYAR